MLETEHRRNDYVGTGLLDTYNYTFKIFHKNDLRVIIIEDDGTIEELVVDTDYTVNNVGYNSGGTIVLLGGDLEVDFQLVILGDKSVIQDSDVRNRGSFYPAEHENFFDYIVMICQQIMERLSRVATVNPWILPADFDPTLPDEMIETGVNRFLKIKDDGTGFELANPAGISVALNDLSDVDTDTAGAGDVLVFDGTNWVDSSRLTDAEAAQAAHEADVSNPHVVTKAQVGLANVDNTSDVNKPVSTAQAIAIAVVQSDIDAHEANTSNPHSVTKAQVGLANVDNTSDATKDAAVATLTNKTLTDPIFDASAIFNEIATPSTPAANKVKVYAKADGNIYKMDDTGAETNIGSGGGGSGTLLGYRSDEDPSPMDYFSNKMAFLNFEYTVGQPQYWYYKIVVPSSYVAGKRIKLSNGQFAADYTSGGGNDILFRLASYLLKVGDSAFVSLGTPYNSTNATVAGTTSNVLRPIGDMYVNDGSGQIDGRNPAPGDTIIIRLTRAVASESSPYAGSAYLLKDSFNISFDN